MKADKEQWACGRSKTEFPDASREPILRLRVKDGLLYSSGITQTGPRRKKK